MTLYHPKPTILVIDDDLATQLLISEILGEAGVHVLQAFRWWDAMMAYVNHQHELALVLLDIMLPGYNGFELLQQLREINARIPVIALSAMSPTELARQSAVAGCHACISKPVFDIGEFLKMIKAYLPG